MRGIEVSQPIVAGNWFSASMALDVTMKQFGRMTMREICVYHLSNGKIDREQFLLRCRLSIAQPASRERRRRVPAFVGTTG